VPFTRCIERRSDDARGARGALADKRARGRRAGETRRSFHLGLSEISLKFMNRTRLAPLAAVVFESRVLRRSGALRRRGWTGEREREREEGKNGNGKARKRRARGPPRVESDVSYE